MPGCRPQDVAQTQALLRRHGYVCDIGLATIVFLALRLGRPLFLEGEPGTGKTEIARTLATALNLRLVRLQCHDGLDVHSAAYEWDRARQLLQIRLSEAAGEHDAGRIAQSLYSRDFLITRPLLSAIDPALPPALLLIDELDRADAPFEAFLLELLEEFQLSIPELGTLRAATPPVVVITSNRTRDVHDAIRRRCLYAWVEYPDAARELEILRLRAPQAGPMLAAQVVDFVQRLRGRELFKAPGAAETLDWARALASLGAQELTLPLVQASLGALIKYPDDAAALDAAALSSLLAPA